MSGVTQLPMTIEASMVRLSSRGESIQALELAARAFEHADIPLRAKIAAFSAAAHFTNAQYDAAGIDAEFALALSEQCDDPQTRAVALAARLLAAAGTPWAGADAIVEQAIVDELWDIRGAFRHLPRADTLANEMLLVEAFFAGGRVEQACQLLTEMFPEHDWHNTPLPRVVGGLELASVPFLPARLLFFLGRTKEAELLAEQLVQQALHAGDHLWATFGYAFQALCAGHRGDAAAVRHFGDLVLSGAAPKSNYLRGAARSFVAFGRAATGDIQGAAVTLRAAGGPSLRWLPIADRALGFELLVGDALIRGNRSAANRWARQLLPLTAHLAASGIAARTFAAIALHDGANELALQHAEAALARSAYTGALREVTKSQLLHARILAKSGRTQEAAVELQQMAHSAEARGDATERRTASRELRSLSRRVLPAHGSGLAALSQGEVDVAILAAQGFGNQAIGAALFLSPRTVQGRVTRILAALGVTRRSAIAGRLLAQAPPGSPIVDLLPSPTDSRYHLPLLTPRLYQVATLVADGNSNDQIATLLGLSRKTVERHISTIFLTWNASSRSEIALLSLGEKALGSHS